MHFTLYFIRWSVQTSSSLLSFKITEAARMLSMRRLIQGRRISYTRLYGCFVSAWLWTENSMQAVGFLLSEFWYYWRINCLAVVTVAVTLAYWLWKVKWFLLDRVQRRHESLVNYLWFINTTLSLIDWSCFDRVLFFSVLLVYNRASASSKWYLWHSLLMICVKLFALPAWLRPWNTVVIPIEWIPVIHIFLQFRNFIFGCFESFN